MRSIALLFTLSLGAQTFVVDIANGPGADFPTLTAAVAAVPDGAVLLVRPGAYAGFTLTARGLTVLADPGVDLTSPLVIGNTAPHQAIVLRGLVWPSAAAIRANAFLELGQCQGPVLVEACVTPDPYLCFVPPCPAALVATACSQVLCQDCVFGGPSRLEATNAVFANCSLIDHDCLLCSSGSPNAPTRALQATDSVVQLRGCTVAGGNGSAYGPGGVPNGAGILLIRSDLRLVGSSVSSGMGPLEWGGNAIHGSSAALRRDPTTVLTARSLPILNVADTVRAMPGLRSSGASLGGSVTAATETAVGDLVVLVVGFGGTPAMVPGFEDAFWLDPTAHSFFAVGVQQSGASVQGTISVPPAANLRGVWLLWHAACFGPVTGMQNSNPAVTLVR